MRKLSFVIALAGLAAVHSGCALIAGYDFGKYGERTGEGGGGSATTASSAAGLDGGGSGTTSVTSTSSGAGGGAGMTVLYSGSGRPTSLAIDDDAVYFTASTDPFNPTGRVMRATKDGSIVLNLATAEAEPFAITVDATHAYWFASPMNTGLVRRAVKIGGGTVEVMADAMEGIGGVATQGQILYWTTPISATVWSMPASGTTPVKLVMGQSGAGDIAVDASGIYWVNRGMAGQFNGAVMRADLDGANVQTLASGQNFPLRLSLDQGHVYWATLDGVAAGIDKAGKTSAFTYVFGGGGPPVTGIAADGAHVYYSLDKDVFKVPLNSLTAEKLLSGLTSPKDLAVDATSLYVAVVDAGNASMVLKIAK